MRLFHKCKHLWLFKGCDKRRISINGRITIREKYICEKCGRIKRVSRKLGKRAFSNISTDKLQEPGEWFPVYDQEPIDKVGE